MNEQSDDINQIGMLVISSQYDEGVITFTV